MAKAVLMSIQPKWCELIASGKKTVEVRKTRPKLKTPFKVYIYCTKPKTHFRAGCGLFSNDELYRLPTGEIKYGCSLELLGDWADQYDENNFLYGKVIGEFICDWIESTPLWRIRGKTGFCAKRTKREEALPQMSCLSIEDLEKYAGSKNGLVCGWHISNLVIYDEPKELREFIRICPEWEKEKITSKCLKCEHHFICNADCFEGCDCEGELPITRPPQSWCYVE